MPLVDSWDSGDPRVHNDVRTALHRLPLDLEIPATSTDVSSLVDVYRRRVGRSPDVLGDAGLLRRLEVLDDAEILGGTVSVEGVLIAFWVDLRITHLIECVIGPDRRVDDR